MKLSKFSSRVFNGIDSLGFIHDYYSLGAVTGIRPKDLSFLLRRDENRITGRESRQNQIKIKGRTVYESVGSLKNAQTRLVPLLQSVYRLHPEAKQPMLAYIPGKDPRVELQDCVGYKYMVHFDIKGYFDNIHLSHIEEALQPFGFSKQGAKLIGRLNLVKRKVGRSTVHTLQQGSAASADISNLVGSYYFDTPLQSWLTQKQRDSYPGMQFKYYRYCDNIVVFLGADIDLDLIKMFQGAAKIVAEQGRFRTHKWSITPNNHPKRNQSFLGVVLNQQTRLEKAKYQRIRATLFNACTIGLQEAAYDFAQKNPVLRPYGMSDTGGTCYLNRTAKEVRRKRFLMSMQGNISYLKSINPRHWAELRRLFCMAKALYALEEAHGRSAVRCNTSDSRGYVLHGDLFTIVKQYRSSDYTAEELVKKLEQAVLANVAPKQSNMDS